MCEQILGRISFSTTDKYKTVFKENYFHRRSSKHSRTPMVNIWCLSHWLPLRIEPVPYPSSPQMQGGWMTTESSNNIPQKHFRHILLLNTFIQKTKPSALYCCGIPSSKITAAHFIAYRLLQTVLRAYEKTRTSTGQCGTGLQKHFKVCIYLSEDSASRALSCRNKEALLEKCTSKEGHSSIA